MSEFSEIKPQQDGRLGEATIQSTSREAEFRKEKQKGTLMVSNKLLSTQALVISKCHRKGQLGQGSQDMPDLPPAPWSALSPTPPRAQPSSPTGFPPSYQARSHTGSFPQARLTPYNALLCE